MALVHRKNTILRDSSSSPEWGTNYTVTVYPVAGYSETAGTTATPTISRGHSFRATAGLPDKAWIISGSTATGTVSLTAVTATSYTTGASQYTYSVGDILVNLGPDTGAPSNLQFDGSPMAIFSDPDGSTAISNATVTANSLGEYEYFHKGSGAFCEVIRDGSGNFVGIVNGFGGQPGVYNVQDYGAVGDGSTNDGPRIQACLDAIEDATDEGGTLYFPPGQYQIDTALDTDRPNVRWIGAGGAGFGDIQDPVSVLQADTAIIILTIDGVNMASGGWGGHHFENIGFADTSGAGTVTGGLQCDRVKMMSFTNVSFTNFWGGFGVHANADSGKNCDYWTWRHPRFQDCLNSIQITESASDWTFYGGRLEGSAPTGTFRANQKGVMQAGSTGAVARWNVYGTTFNDFSTCLDLDRPRKCCFLSCAFEQGSGNDLTGTAIDLAGDATSNNWGDYNVFVGCEVEGFATGITLSADCTGNRFNDCFIHNCTTEISDSGKANTFNNRTNANDGSAALATARQHGMYYSFLDDASAAGRVGFNATAETTSGGVNLLKRVPIIEHPDNRAIVVKDNTMQAAGTVGGLVFGTTAAGTAGVGGHCSGDLDAPTAQGTDCCLIYFNGDNIQFYNWAGVTAGDALTLSGNQTLDVRPAEMEVQTMFVQTVQTLANSATPSVAGGNIFITNAAGTTITNFNNSIVGQVIYIKAGSAITITDNANIVLNSAGNFVMATGDTLTLVAFTSGVHTEVARTVI